MIRKNKTPTLLLALMLALSFMALSAHVTLHAQADPGTCAQCIVQGSAASAIPPESFIVEVTPTHNTSHHSLTTTRPGIRYIHYFYGRAPPVIV